jgi:AraC-like DNA-binding protein
VGLVAALLSDRSREARLRTAMRERHQLVVAKRWAEFLDLCGSAPMTAAVIDLADYGHATFDELRQFRARHDSTALVLYIAVPPVAVRDVFEAGRFGFDAIVVADTGDAPHELQEVIERAMARGVGELLRKALGDVAPTARDATLASVARAHERLSPEKLARLLGVRRRALTERLGRAGFPAPQRLIAWGRLIVAARMLEDADRKADAIALALDFPSGSAFRNTCQRYLGATPQEIRLRGGATYAIGAFLRAVHSGEAVSDSDDMREASEGKSDTREDTGAPEST